LNRWIYWNMNYHVEHHIYPSVPFHQLKKLHLAVKDQLPAPYPSTISALREVVYALRRQAKDENFYIKRQLPQPAA
ncbi:MAG: fatty acid desaturase, partial [Actinomycetota bacterium]